MGTPCRNEQVMHLFYGDTFAEQRMAAAMCTGCPLFEECRARGADEEYGVWGGLTEWDRPEAKQRARDRRKRQREQERQAEQAQPPVTVVRDMGPKTRDAAVRATRNAEIVALRAEGVRVSVISKRYGLHPNMVGRICAASRLGA